MSTNKSFWNLGDKILLLHDENYQENRLFNYYSVMGLNRFKWSNLPEGMESRHIEKALFQKGQAFFYKSDKYGFICLPCNECKELNVYGDPLGVNVTGVNFSEVINIDDGVRILDNDLQFAPQHHIYYYVQLLGRVERTITMNLEQQKFPLIMATTKANELTMRNIYKKYSDFEQIMFTDEKLANSLTDGDGLQVANTSVPYLLDKLVDFKKSCQSELYTFLGLNNNDVEKKERLLTNEINANNGTVLMSLDLAFKNRQKACEKINKKFGLNVKVEKTIDNLDVDFLGEIKRGDKAWQGTLSNSEE